MEPRRKEMAWEPPMEVAGTPHRRGLPTVPMKAYGNVNAEHAPVLALGQLNTPSSTLA